MAKLRHLTWNLCDFGDPSTLTPERRADALDVITSIAPDIISVQEIMGEDRTANFLRLAADLGMDAQVPVQAGPPVPAFVPGNRSRGVGLLWRRNLVSPVVGSLRSYTLTPFYTGMALAKFEVDGKEIAVASTHLAPRLPNQRADELLYTGLEIRAAAPNGIIGADWNSVFASIRSNGEYYDADPYANLHWHHEFAAQCFRDPRRLIHYSDRAPMQNLLNAGLVDPAAHIDAPWYATTGHWTADAVRKRIDGPFVTPTLANATKSICSFDSEVTRRVSDHLPVVCDFDLSNLSPT
jgi:endonuclease/exonuclease/phosphatase family metal-dependent hydrolase